MMGNPGSNTWKFIKDQEQKARDLKELQFSTGTVDPESVYAGAGPRGIASDIINRMSNEFYDPNDQYSGVSLKKDLESMTTYGNNKGVLGMLNQEATANNAMAFNVAGGDDGTGGMAGRNLERFGGALTPQQAMQQKSEFTRSKVLGEVDATNRNNLYQNDLNKQVLSGLGSTNAATLKKA